MITQRPVVGMFLDGHELQGIVPRIDHPGQDLLPKFFIGSDFFLRLRHADVGFIDPGGFRRAAEKGLPPNVGMFRLPDLCGEQFGGRVLDDAPSIGWNSLPVSSRPAHQKFVKLTGPQFFLRETHFPVSVFSHFLQGKIPFFLPVGKITDQGNGGGIRRPFAKYPFGTLTVQTEVFMS